LVDLFKRKPCQNGVMVTMTKTTKKTKSVTGQTQKAKPVHAGIERVAAPVSAQLPAPVKAAAQTAPAPELPKTNHVSLQLIRPDAKQVCVAGSFNEWKPEQTPLKPAGDGRWVGDLAVNPGRYEYLFVVDGQWLPDPNAIESVRNPFGGMNSVLVAS
jgi:hypothetical protein